ncbi:PAS domain S-box-containing protein [Saonia flava]|uniref:histidine kinase n=1 Tax=Saonia flava TaxID=523696 RepID=A0A846QS58_9FLAO|nr:ATP-binding protein [Saonia flava]NJB70037.1 PAS domain S-box-containing protein [Saonia flava]
MKFSSGLCFFLLGFGILAMQRKSAFYILLSRVATSAVWIISILTMAYYFFGFNYSIDSLYVDDIYYSISSKRISLITAACFSLLALAISGMQSKSQRTKRIMQYVFFAVILISFIDVLIHILNIPVKGGNKFPNAMAVQTSFLLFWFSSLLSLKNATKDFNKFYFGNYAGSKIIRIVAPYNFTMIMIMGILLLYLINNNIVDVNFGFIIYTVVAVFVSIVYLIVVAKQLNETEHEREVYESAFRASTKEMNQFKEALDDSSLVDITDANGVITSVNDKFCEISKYERSELIGRTHRILNSGHHSKEFFTELWTKIKKGEVWVGGIKNKTKTGEFYWVHTAIIPFKNESGEIYQFLTIRQDITKLTLLSVQYENLKLRNKEIEQFTYIASHDLQEPLRTVRSMIDILQDQYQGKLDKDAQLSLNFITEATDRMSDLIKGLLDYSRIGGGKELRSFDSNDTIRIIKRDLASAIKRTNTSITMDQLPVLKAYRTEVRLLFQNLISNAIKFHKEGVFPRIHISAKEDDGYWRFSVQDNGIGIAEKDNRNVFAIFQRLNKRNAYEGTGIGLAHCEKIVHLHGGEIWVESKLNEGSTFYFTIPRNLN